MQIPFEKWHGAKNDFLVVALSATDGTVADSLKRQAPEICSRRGAGVGADGILLLRKTSHDSPYPEEFSVINSDGSIGATCGNGLRCAAHYVYNLLKEERDDVAEGVTFSTDAGEVYARFLQMGANSLAAVSVDMGVPQVNDALPWYGEAKSAVEEQFKAHAVKSQIIDIGACEIGNQHIVVFCDGAGRDALLKVGPALQDGYSWSGINVHMVENHEIAAAIKANATQALGGGIEDCYRALVWERGAGETMACGSGACAITACALEFGLSSHENWSVVEMPGGALFAKQSDPDAPVTLAGPAVRVFRGSLDF